MVEARKILEGQPRGWTALMQAVKDGDLAGVERLLAQGAEPNQIAEGAVTALRSACWDGHTKIVRALLGAGADPDIRGRNDSTAVTLAIIHGHDEIFDALVEAGASVMPDYHGHSPLTVAIYADRMDYLECLCEGPLPHSEPDSAFNFACSAGKIDAVRLLWSLFGDEVLRLGDDIGNPLMIAAAADASEVVEFLLEHGADPNDFDLKDELSPLMHAAGAGAYSAARTLIEHGADVNDMSEWFVTPLSQAHQQRDTQMLQILAEAGARPQDGEGESMGLIVMPWGSYGTVPQPPPEEPQPNPTPPPPTLIDALHTGDTEALADLLEAGEDPFARKHYGEPSACILAMRQGRGQVVRAFIAAKPDGFPAMDHDFMAFVVDQPDPWLLRLCVERGADLNTRDWRGNTLLDLAVRKKRYANIALLLLNDLDHKVIEAARELARRFRDDRSLALFKG